MQQCIQLSPSPLLKCEQSHSHNASTPRPSTRLRTCSGVRFPANAKQFAFLGPQKCPRTRDNFCGVCLKKSEPILRRTPTNEDAPPLPRFARQHQRKMFLAFRTCARPISSKKERTFFFGALPSKYSGRWRGDNSIRSGMAEFPPHPPSAVFLRGRTEILAAADLRIFQ